MEDTIEPRWRRSSYSGNGGANCVEVASYRWRKSSYSGNGGGDCVEVASDRWQKSSHSGNGGSDCVEVASDRWQKSSYSGNGGGNCVEVASSLPSSVLVRDSKNREGSMLTVTDTAWSAFVRGIRRGEFDL